MSSVMILIRCEKWMIWDPRGHPTDYRSCVSPTDNGQKGCVGGERRQGRRYIVEEGGPEWRWHGHAWAGVHWRWASVRARAKGRQGGQWCSSLEVEDRGRKDISPTFSLLK